MKKVLRSGKFTVTVNKDFKSVIQNCSEMKRKGQSGTWITKEMIDAYCKLHEFGKAQSIEVWHPSSPSSEGQGGSELVGGMYGIPIGPSSEPALSMSKCSGVFCGESMFSKVNNASKIALIYATTEMGYELIDCQMKTKHLESMGAQFITRDKFQNHLSKQVF